MNKKIILGLVVAGATLLSSCKKEGCTNSEATNYDENAKKDDGTCLIPTNSYNIPSTYVFADANGNNTVSFDGQKQRLNMLTEMVAYLKTANTKGTTINATTLKEMYDNTYTEWSESELVGSSKQLKNKTAGGDETITAMFELYMDSVATISTLNIDGSAGQSGVYPNDGNKGPYLMDANGVEYTQWIEKGLMGAVFYYNISQVYFSDSKMDVDNTDPVDEAAEKFYTEMEHHWDEAYGYFSSEVDYPTNGTDRFWGKYANSSDDVLGSATKIAEAYRKGRAAISNDDLDTRDDQITIIRTELEKVIAASAIHYLNSSISDIALNTTRNHSLSEATAFLKSLAYGYDAKITQSEIDNILATIGEDFNNVTSASLTTARNDLASIMGLDDLKDQL